MGIFTWDAPKKDTKLSSLDLTNQEAITISAAQAEEMAEVNAAIEAEFWAAEEQEELRRQAMRSYVPPVTVEKFAAGDFVCVGKQQFPRAFIEDIAVMTVGAGPVKLRRTEGYYEYLARFGGRETNTYALLRKRGKYVEDMLAGGVIAAKPAKIEVTMSSGAKHIVECHRFEVEILHDALCKAWKAKT